jgi:hypothetical protein
LSFGFAGTDGDPDDVEPRELEADTIPAMTSARTIGTATKAMTRPLPLAVEDVASLEAPSPGASADGTGARGASAGVSWTFGGISSMRVSAPQNEQCSTGPALAAGRGAPQFQQRCGCTPEGYQSVDGLRR